jgi:hypothetical protein
MYDDSTHSSIRLYFFGLSLDFDEVVVFQNLTKGFERNLGFMVILIRAELSF